MFNDQKMLCTKCEQVDYPKTKSGGSFIAELLLWFVFITISLFASAWVLIIPLIYSITRTFNKHKVCASCASTDIISADSPKAKRLLGNNEETTRVPPI